MALLVVLTYRCWTLYRIMPFVYVLVLIEPLHPPACVYLQTNHLSASGGERNAPDIDTLFTDCDEQFFNKIITNTSHILQQFISDRNTNYTPSELDHRIKT